MSWDFQTEPEFQQVLDWADQFVRDEVEPLDYRAAAMAKYADVLARVQAGG
jgi:hypothetical protein